MVRRDAKVGKHLAASPKIRKVPEYVSGYHRCHRLGRSRIKCLLRTTLSRTWGREHDGLSRGNEARVASGKLLRWQVQVRYRLVCAEGRIAARVHRLLHWAVWRRNRHRRTHRGQPWAVDDQVAKLIK